MEESNSFKEDLDDSDKNESKGILSYGDDQKQVLFRFLGVEMTAPKGLKNPRMVYISFVVINIILLILLQRLTSH